MNHSRVDLTKKKCRCLQRSYSTEHIITYTKLLLILILAKDTVHLMNSLTRPVPTPKSHNNFITAAEKLQECIKCILTRYRSKVAEGSVNLSIDFSLLPVLWSRSMLQKLLKRFSLKSVRLKLLNHLSALENVTHIFCIYMKSLSFQLSTMLLPSHQTLLLHLFLKYRPLDKTDEFLVSTLITVLLHYWLLT